MYSSGTTVIYGTHGVCTVKEIAEHSFGSSINTYYVLQPMNDAHSQIFVPCENETLVSRIRPVLSVKQVDEVIDKLICGIDTWVSYDVKRKEFTSNLIKNGNKSEIIAVIEQLYVKQDELRRQKKHYQLTDERYLKEAMKLLIDEFSFVLGISSDDVTDYVVSRLKINKQPIV